MNLIEVNTQTLETTRGPIPKNIIGLKPESLQNLQTELDPVPEDLLNREWWPEVVEPQTLASSEKFGAEVLTPDTQTKTVKVSRIVEQKTTEDIENERLSVRMEVVNLMIEKQAAGVTYNGMPIATDGNALAQMVGGRQQQQAWRKIVPRFGRGRKLQLAEAEFNTMFLAIENYIQSVQDWAYDLIVQIDDGLQPDINAGWPSNEL